MILERLKGFFMRPFMQNNERTKIALRFHRSPLGSGEYYADFYAYDPETEKASFTDSTFVSSVVETLDAIHKADVVLSPPMDFPYFEGTGPFEFISGVLGHDEVICCWDEKYVLIKKENTDEYYVLERKQAMKLYNS